jgi:hypothetical protein
VATVIASDATMVIRFIPTSARAAAGKKEKVHHGISLRNMR